MAAAAAAIDELVAPISVERPAGEDVTLAPEWQEINQARRRDKVTGRPNADWPTIKQLLVETLAHKSKDLRVAVWLMEANIKLDGFSGLREGAGLLRALMTAYWDSGLYPEVEGGDLQFRAVPLEWLGGENFAQAIRQITVTARSDGGRDCSYIDYRQSRDIGWERDTRNSMGDADPDKEARRNSLLATGGVSAELFEEAIKATRRAGIEKVAAEAESAWQEFLALDRTLDEKLGAEAPGTSEAKDAIEDCRRLLTELVNRKRLEEPDKVATAGGGPSETASRQLTSWDSLRFEEADGAGSWREAEEMVRQGKVQEGLAQMTQLSAREYGRAHFQHRLRLGEICLGIGRERLAIKILEELAKSIEELHLERWESPELLGRVWGRLYRCYKSAEAGSEQSVRAADLFDRLCRLDPWQALRWDE